MNIKVASFALAALGALFCWPRLHAADFEYSFDGPTTFAAPAGETVEEGFDCLLTALDDNRGVRAWCMSMTAEGGGILSITTEGTQVPELLADGFQRSEITSGPGNEGAVTCVILSFSDPRIVLPQATTRVASVRAKFLMPAECGEARLRYVHGRRSDFGPIANAVLQGDTLRPVRKRPHAIALMPGGKPCGAPEPEPQGWIRAGDWNLLFPLANPYGCDGGGEETRHLSWTAPHDIAFESPTAGTEWSDIAFGAAARSTAFEAAALFARKRGSSSPVWSNLAWLADLGFLETADGCDPATGALDCDDVDLRALTERLNTRVLELGIPTVPLDGLLGLAQTYVENRTAEPRCVGICAASEDGLQVWVNDLPIADQGCGGSSTECMSPVLAFLDPGVNKISVVSWQGTGSWSFRLTLIDPVTGAHITGDRQTDIAFLGTSPASSPRITPAVSRHVPNADACPGNRVVVVTLRGDGHGEGLVSVTEELGDVGQVVGASNDGTVVPREDGVTITWQVPAEILNATGVTYDLQIAAGEVARPVGTVGGCARIGGVQEVTGSRSRSGPVGLLDDSHDIGEEAEIGATPGALMLEFGIDGVSATSDDVFTITGAGNAVGDEGDSFRYAYRRIKGDFRATVRILERLYPPVGGRRGRYGLMARRDCSPTSKYSLVHANLEADPGPDADHRRGDGVFWQFRRNHRVAAPNVELGFPFDVPGEGGGAGVDGALPLEANQPNFFRLERRGTLLSGYASYDGVEWKFIGSDTWYESDAKEELLVGFMYSKGADAPEAGTIAISDFTIEHLPPAEVFDNDAGAAGDVLWHEDFAALPDGPVPEGWQANCGSGCEAFQPRVVNGRLRLTQEGAAESATSVFLKRPVPAASGALVIELTAYISHSGVTRQPVSGDPNPGYGLTLTVMAGRRFDLVGTAREGLGYEDIHRGFDRAEPSFSVEIDTWAGQRFNERGGSPDNDGDWHLAINTGGSTHSRVVSPLPLPDIFRPEGVRFRVIYRSEGKVTVSILDAGVGGGGGVGGAVVAEADVDPLSGAGAQDAIVGFTGATGSSSETGEIGDVVVIGIDCSDADEVGQVEGPSFGKKGELLTLDASGSIPGVGDGAEAELLSYSWSVTGDGAIEGPSDGPLVNMRLGSPVGDGEVIARVLVSDGRCRTPSTAVVEHRIEVRGPRNWRAYDGNSDGKTDLSDAIFHLSFLFAGGSPPACPEAMDYNGDQSIDISDPVGMLLFLFAGGLPPRSGEGCRGFPACGAAAECDG